MSNVNKVVLLGRLTRDPDMRFTDGGTEVTDFSLAVKRVWKTQDGDPQEDTTFVDIVAWGKQAKLIGENVKKGQRLFVEGRLKLERWETQDGEKRSKLRVHVENFQFIERKDDDGAPRASASVADEEVPF